ncbi:MAG: UbiA family prenyltransferase [Candidatus Thermoplasmatota archaeon]|jgi:protoheme IX farnesyltransferase|nr:UbiA family prenyltransferase [Candidatus Thermoplasmatota archaeon]MCL5790072.1 UbiA family prenyltransferase [Candidatus Thermoplasmatota archaeon]
MGNFIGDFFVMTKPRVWVFLLITGIAGEVFALSTMRSLDVGGFLYVVLYIALGLMGAESVSNYFDISIDRMMNRTKERALPSGRMKPSVALYGGLVLIAATLILSFFRSFLSFAFMATGIFDYTIIYSYLTKKRTAWNIILGAYSGGAPLLAGFYAFTSSYNPVAILMFLTIFIWTPLHIWSLSIRYRDDYAAASVPMLPVGRTTRQSMNVLFPIAILAVAVTVLTGYEFRLYFPFFIGIALFVVYVALGVYLLASYLLALAQPDKRIMKLFVSTNIFIGMFFVFIAIFSLLIPFVGVLR